jgi:hypothetical protein
LKASGIVKADFGQTLSLLKKREGWKKFCRGSAEFHGMLSEDAAKAEPDHWFLLSSGCTVKPSEIRIISDSGRPWKKRLRLILHQPIFCPVFSSLLQRCRILHILLQFCYIQASIINTFQAGSLVPQPVSFAQIRLASFWFHVVYFIYMHNAEIKSGWYWFHTRFFRWPKAARVFSYIAG